VGERLIFDGDCGFCTTSAGWMRRRLPATVEVVPWQRVELDEIGLTKEQVSTAAYWVTASGERDRGHRAVGHALLRCGGGWKLLGRLCLVAPTSWIAAAVYRLVARYRYRLPGGTPACRLN
jgi:predicted DCC family thiol-disulfide oxidoreductase YuxK